MIVVPHVDESPDSDRIDRAVLWHEFLDSAPATNVPLPRFPFNHPLYILYSSGTTGVPKCIVHGAGGTLLQHLKEHQLHCDITPGDRVFYFTTLRLDDVELAGHRARVGGDAAALTTARRFIRRQRRSSTSPTRPA